MSITFAIGRIPEPDELKTLFNSSGINRPENLDRIRRMLANSNLIVSAWDEVRLIGIARALTDFSFCSYLSDLAVAKEYQGQGIGKELIRRVSEAAGPECNLILLSSPSAQTYYPHIGLNKATNAWLLPRLAVK